jgi:hypothetical protein
LWSQCFPKLPKLNRSDYPDDGQYCGPRKPIMTLCGLLLNGLVQAIPNVSAVQAV